MIEFIVPTEYEPGIGLGATLSSAYPTMVDHAMVVPETGLKNALYEAGALYEQIVERFYDGVLEDAAIEALAGARVLANRAIVAVISGREPDGIARVRRGDDGGVIYEFEDGSILEIYPGTRRMYYVVAGSREEYERSYGPIEIS